MPVGMTARQMVYGQHPSLCLGSGQIAQYSFPTATVTVSGMDPGKKGKQRTQTDELPSYGDLQNPRSVFFKVWPTTTVSESDAWGKFRFGDLTPDLLNNNLWMRPGSLHFQKASKIYAHSSLRTIALQALHMLFLLSRKPFLAHPETKWLHIFKVLSSVKLCMIPPKCSGSLLSLWIYFCHYTHLFIRPSIHQYLQNHHSARLYLARLPTMPTFSF